MAEVEDYVSDLTPGVKVREKVELGTPDKSIVELAKSDTIHRDVYTSLPYAECPVLVFKKKMNCACMTF